MRYRLSRTLEHLLIDHDCVVVPQLGAFIREHQPASWDASHSLVSPPSVVLRFNEALQHQDGLLLEAYTRTLGVSQRRAKIELEQDIAALRQTLVREQQYTIEGIGLLSLSPEGRISFNSKPSEDIAYPYYGLPSVPASFVGEGEERANAGDNTTQGFASDDKTIRITIPRSYVRYGSVVASVLLLIGLSWLAWSPIQASYTAWQANRAKAKTEIAVDPTTILAETKTMTQELVAEEVAEPTPSLWAEPVSGQYYLIIGTENRRSNAERYIELYQEKYPRMSILEGKKKFRVSAEQFASKEEATERLRELSKEGVSAWIYHL